MAEKLYSFRETKNFTKDLMRLLSDEDYAELQYQLIDNPEFGDLIVGSGGLRKIRWTAQGRGKRGGVRVIYYWADKRGYIFMLAIYAKNEQENLSKEQLEQMRDIIKKWLP